MWISTLQTGQLLFGVVVTFVSFFSWIRYPFLSPFFTLLHRINQCPADTKEEQCDQPVRFLLVSVRLTRRGGWFGQLPISSLFPEQEGKESNVQNSVLNNASAEIGTSRPVLHLSSFCIGLSFLLHFFWVGGQIRVNRVADWLFVINAACACLTGHHDCRLRA